MNNHIKMKIYLNMKEKLNYFNKNLCEEVKEMEKNIYNEKIKINYSKHNLYKSMSNNLYKGNK